MLLPKIEELENSFTENTLIIDLVKQEGNQNKKNFHTKSRNYWEQNEDLRLLELVEKHGEKWSKIASLMKGRTGKQIRDRYVNYLRPNIKQKRWSQEEDNLLQELYKEFGNKWSKIAIYLHGRTENQVKNRFYSSERKEKRRREKRKKMCKIEPDLVKLVKKDPELEKSAVLSLKNEPPSDSVAQSFDIGPLLFNKPFHMSQFGILFRNMRQSGVMEQQFNGIDSKLSQVPQALYENKNKNFSNIKTEDLKFDNFNNVSINISVTPFNSLKESIIDFKNITEGYNPLWKDNHPVFHNPWLNRVQSGFETKFES